MKIIISADDFGRSHERNLAINDAFKSGLIKSAGLLVNAKYTAEAVTMAKEGGYINHLHCHFNIEGGDICGFAKPLSEKMKKCSIFCQYGEFREHNNLKLISYYNIWLTSIVFDELEKQYLLFKELTNGQGNEGHIDFHLWNNYRWPVSLALHRLIKKYAIKSYRKVGLHYSMKGIKAKVLCGVSNLLCRNDNCIMGIPACHINYYLYNKNTACYCDKPIWEVYVHPDYVDGVLLDNTHPVFFKNKYPLAEHLEMLSSQFGKNFISWSDI